MNNRLNYLSYINKTIDSLKFTEFFSYIDIIFSSKKVELLINRKMRL